MALAVTAGLLACKHAAPADPSKDVTAPAPPGLFTDHVSGAGRPVIFIPDLGAPAEVWDSTVAHLGGRVEAHVLDIAGFAGNPAAEGPVMPALPVELASYIRARNLKRPIVVGHMFGASVGYQIAMAEPALLGGLVAIDSPPSHNTGDAEETAEAEGGRRALAEAPPERFAQMTQRRMVSSMKDEAATLRLAEKASRSNQGVVAAAFHAMMTTDTRPRIPLIQAPVLVILTTGNLPEGMATVVEGAFKEQLAPIPTHELVVVPGARHYVMMDAPEDFFKVLDRFIAAHAH